MVAQSTELGDGNAGDLEPGGPEPRFDAPAPECEGEVEEAPEWSINSSMFKNMVPSEEHYSSCFQTDIMNGRINGIINNPKAKQNILKLIREHYP